MSMHPQHGPYSDLVMDHFLQPRHAGALTAATGAGEVKNNTCGDVTRIYVRIEEERVQESGFLASGCGPGIACASYLLEQVTRKTVSEALAVRPDRIVRALSLPREKRHAAEMAVESLSRAVEDHRARGSPIFAGSEARPDIAPDSPAPINSIMKGH